MADLVKAQDASQGLVTAALHQTSFQAFNSEYLNDVSMAPRGGDSSSPAVSASQQNEVSSKAISREFLKDVALTFKGGDAYAVFDADVDAHNLIYGLKGDPLKQQALNQIASDMSDPAVMQKLGLEGSVFRDRQGNVVALEFRSPQAVASYQNDLLTLEKSGQTPTQAAESLGSQHLHVKDSQGTAMYDTKNPQATPPLF